MNLEGIIPLAVGVYGWLLVTGKIEAKSKDPGKMAQWRRKWGPTMKVIFPLIAVYGLLLLAGVLEPR